MKNDIAFIMAASFTIVWILLLTFDRILQIKLDCEKRVKPTSNIPGGRMGKLLLASGALTAPRR